MASLKVEICLKKKKATRAQIFLYFRIENRNHSITQSIIITRKTTERRENVKAGGGDKKSFHVPEILGHGCGINAGVFYFAKCVKGKICQ